MGLNTKGLTIFHKPWFASTPQNAKKASATLTLMGVVSDTETCTIGSNVYEFDINDTYTAGRIQVDISTLRNQATGVLTFIGIPVVTETVVIDGTETYEFVAAAGDVQAGNIAVALGETLTADNACTVLAQVINANSELVTAVADTEGDTVTITSVVRGTSGNAITSTETCTNAGFAGDTLSGGLDTITAANAVTALVSAITANDEYATGVGGTGTTVVIAYKWVGTDGNSHAVSESMANGSFGEEVTTLSGGQFATPCNASSAVIIIDNTIYFTDKPCDKWTQTAWYSCVATLL